MIRLISTHDLSLHTFSNPSTVPSYAILSHRWQDGELSLPDLRCNLFTTKSGWSNLRYFSTFASCRGFDYIWIDTCCIDRSSNAELSEAINSMFRWYRRARTCFAYLFDVPGRRNSKQGDWVAQFQRSEWFTRGWTLQELLAPREIIFVCADWTEEIGTRVGLSQDISAVTGIPEKPLKEGWWPHDQFGASQYPVAQVMAWAAERKTTLVEDMAYSLIGLLRINMPLLYGEGLSAFVRLQLEIMHKYDDNSLFAWKLPRECQSLGTNRAVNRFLDLPETFWWGSLLAPTIRLFKGCNGHFLQIDGYEDGRLFSMTNRGILVRGLLRRHDSSRHSGKRWLLPLNCGRNEIWTHRIGLVLSGDRQLVMRGVNLMGFDSDLVDCDIDAEKAMAGKYEYREVYISQAWPGDFD
jgi:hypothetical protein